MLSQRNRHRLFEAGFSALSWLAADRWLAPAARGRGLILTFHHVRPQTPEPFAPNALLAITPDCLDRTLTLLRARGFALIGLDDLPARLNAVGGPPFAVLTFDDGYRDNVDFAAPVLAAHRAPWTLFVTSDFADGRGRLWWIELERAIGRLDRVRLPGALFDEVDAGSSSESAAKQKLGAVPDRHAIGHGSKGGGSAFDLDLPARTAQEKSAAFDAVYRHLRGGSEPRLLAVIAALCAEAGIAPGAVAGELCLSWSELRALSLDPAVTIGAHTLSHPMLAKRDAAFAAREITASRARLAHELGRPIRHLSYPVGDPTSAGAREFGLARDLGFVTAVTTRPGHLFAGHAGHLHALPRVSINGLHQGDAALASLISGVPFLAWNRGRRLNVA